MTFLPLLQTVMTRLQKHFIDLVGINFDMNGAVRRGSRVYLPEPEVGSGFR